MNQKKIVIIKKSTPSQETTHNLTTETPMPCSNNILETGGKPDNRASTDPVVYIDSSYFSFYRANATRSWFIRAYPDDNNHNWITNETFMQMYEKKFREHVAKIAKTLRVPLEALIFVRDSPREEIWRTKIFPQYKAHRQDCDGSEKLNNHSMGPVIKYSNDHILSHEATNRLPVTVLRLSGVEADDIIAYMTHHHNHSEPERKVYIIANDTDFYQLLGNPNNTMFSIGTKYTLTHIREIPENYLEVKILCGDKTDNIPPIFPGCGPATARNLVSNHEKLQEIFSSKPDVKAQYELNKKLIGFSSMLEISTELGLHNLLTKL